MTPLGRLAWRSLWRQRRRTILLLVVVAYATLAIVFLWGFMDGFLNAILSSQGRLAAAPVLITSTAYHDNPSPSHPLAVLAPLERAALLVPGVRHVAPRIDFGALLRSPYTSEGVAARGVDPTLESSVSAVPGAVTQGHMLTGPGQIVVGKGVANQLDVRIGERLAVDVSAAAGAQSLGLTVVGIIDAGTPVVDDGTALVDIADARRLTGVRTATGLALDVPRGREKAVANALNQSLPGTDRAYPVQALIGSLVHIIGWGHVEVAVLAAVFSLLAAVAVMSTLVVSVLERTREFGVMMAVGLDQGQLGSMITLESVLSAALGWLIGVAAGYALLWLFSVWNVFGPLFASLFGGLLSGIALGDQLTTAVHPLYLLYALAPIALAALFAALVPARRVRSLQPAEAMRSE